MDLVGQGSNQDFADGLARLLGAFSLLGGSAQADESATGRVEPTRRAFGSITEAAATVLGSAGAMRVRDIHEAIEGLLGEPVSWSSVKNCLARQSIGDGRRFERVSRGCYRLARR